MIKCDRVRSPAFGRDRLIRGPHHVYTKSRYRRFSHVLSTNNQKNNLYTSIGMSQKNLLNHELMIPGSGAGDAHAHLPEKRMICERKSPGSKPVIDELSKKITEYRKSVLRRALTLNDMSPPRARERLQKNTASKIGKNEFLGKQLVMSKLISTLYYKLWKKKKIQSDELKEQIKQLLVQKSFLNQMREKESRKRDELTKISERLYKNVAEYEAQILKLKEEKDSLKLTLHNMTTSFTEIRLELEKSEYLKSKFQKINNEHLEYMHRINEELAKLKIENKDQKRKILYMNNVADQQDYNLKQLHKIAEELDVNLKENIEYARNALRRRDEAIEKEEQASYRSKMLESCLKESKETEKNLHLEINQIKYLVDESEKRKLLITLENVDLKYKLETTEKSLQDMLAQVKYLENERQREVASQKTVLGEFCHKVITVMPWNSLFHLGLHLFPLIASSFPAVY